MKKNYQSGNKISNTNVKFKFKSVSMWWVDRYHRDEQIKFWHFIQDPISYEVQIQIDLGDRFESNPLGRTSRNKFVTFLLSLLVSCSEESEDNARLRMNSNCDHDHLATSLHDMSTCNVSIVMFSIDLISIVISDYDFNSDTSTKVNNDLFLKLTMNWNT